LRKYAVLILAKKYALFDLTKKYVLAAKIDPIYKLATGERKTVAIYSQQL
jgi:hypothetical protein